jgi:hypothetical protein
VVVFTPYFDAVRPTRLQRVRTRYLTKNDSLPYKAISPLFAMSNEVNGFEIVDVVDVEDCRVRWSKGYNALGCRVTG